MIRNLSPRNSTYAWRWNMPADAETVGAELEKIQEEYGELTPTIVVDSARPDNSPMHKLFTWDDAVAGELHRQNEARFILRNLRIEYTRKDEQDEPKILKVRAFLNVETNDDDAEDDTPVEPRRVYMSTSAAFQNPQHRRYVLDRAKSELEMWRNRYAALREFDGVISEIDAVLKKLTTEVKAAA